MYSFRYLYDDFSVSIACLRGIASVGTRLRINHSQDMSHRLISGSKKEGLMPKNILDVDAGSIQDDAITRICFVDRDVTFPPVHEHSLVVDGYV